MVYIAFLLSFIFYIGVRLNPTLNKEGRIGGSFDLKYVKQYVEIYNFGKKGYADEIQLGSGRGGATLLLWNKLFDANTFSFNDYLGFGLKTVYTTDYEQFDEEKFGVNSKGSITGVFQSYISTGYIGVLLSILLIYSIAALIREPRIRITILLLIYYDYFFYSGLILRTQGFLILLFFIILYSNKQFQPGYFRKSVT